MGAWELCRAVGVMVDMTTVVLLFVCSAACDERARLSSIATKGSAPRVATKGKFIAAATKELGGL